MHVPLILAYLKLVEQGLEVDLDGRDEVEVEMVAVRLGKLRFLDENLHKNYTSQLVGG